MENRFRKTALASVLALTTALGNVAFAKPSCVLEKLDGSGKIDLSQLNGRNVYLDFWASWCGPCKQSFPFMNGLKKQFEAKGVTIVAVSVDKEIKEAQSFAKENGAEFLTVSDKDGACAKELALKGMPSSYIIGKNGEVLFTHSGFRPSDKEAITKDLQQLTER